MLQDTPRIERLPDPDFTRSKSDFEEYRRLLFERFPDYQNTNKHSLVLLNDSDISLIVTVATRSDSGSDWRSLVPQSYRTKYGAYADSQFVNDVYEEADRRNIEFAGLRDVMIGYFAKQAQLSPQEKAGLVVDKPVAIQFADRAEPLVANPVELYAYTISGKSRVATLPNNQSVVAMGIAPSALVIDSIIEASPKAAPKLSKLERDPKDNGLEFGLEINARDAYWAGFMSQSGALDKINPLRAPEGPGMDRASVCKILPEISKDIFDGSEDNVDVQEAWVAGALRRKYGDCSDVAPGTTPTSGVPLSLKGLALAAVGQ